ncbi:MAG: sulfur oxidation c-type cytochrome SoxX [Pseudomonadota bacterium]
MKQRTTAACFSSALAGALLLISQPGLAAEKAKSAPHQGQKLTVGLCQPCHQFTGTSQAGTAGPPLLAMKARFPDRQKLHDIIYDAHAHLRPDTMMPPFGRTGLADEAQIQLMIDFLYTL